MTQPTTPTTTTNPARPVDVFVEVLTAYEDGDGSEASTRALLDFVESLIQTPDDATAHALEFYAATGPNRDLVDTFLAEHGPDATHGEAKAFLRAEQPSIAA